MSRPRRSDAQIDLREWAKIADAPRRVRTVGINHHLTGWWRRAALRVLRQHLLDLEFGGTVEWGRCGSGEWGLPGGRAVRDRRLCRTAPPADGLGGRLRAATAANRQQDGTRLPMGAEPQAWGG